MIVQCQQFPINRKVHIISVSNFSFPGMVMLDERWDTTLKENREEKVIVERILKFIKSGKYNLGHYIMLNNGRVIRIGKYAEMLDEGKISRNEAYAFLDIVLTTDISVFHYPFICCFGTVLDAYLSKRGMYFYYEDDDYDEDQLDYELDYYSVPAPSLKYIAIYVEHERYSAIEVVNLEEVAKNTKIDNILNNYVHGHTLIEEEYEEIYDMFELQELFDGHDFDEAEDILNDYYDDNDTSLEKEVTRILADYNRIFRPFRICFSTKTWSQVDCSAIRF